MGTALPTSTIYADARAAGFNGQDAVTATAIALAESGGNPSAHNPNVLTGDDSWGLWQINLLGALRSRLTKWGLSSPQQLTDPVTNAKAAFSLYSARGGSFADWSTYKNGHYRDYLPQAMAAATGTASPDTLTPATGSSTVATPAGFGIGGLDFKALGLELVLLAGGVGIIAVGLSSTFRRQLGALGRTVAGVIP